MKKGCVASICRQCGSKFGQKRKTEYEQKRLGISPMCHSCRKKEMGDRIRGVTKSVVERRKTCACGKKCRGEEFGWCRAKHRREEKLTVSCHLCGVEFGLARRYWIQYEKKGHFPACPSCRGKIAGERFAHQTKEERAEALRLSAVSRKGNSYDVIRKQWETIRADPEKLEKLLAKRRYNMDRVWAEMPEEERNRRVGLFFSSHHKARSKGNDALKRMMEEDGLYDGFASEQVFHGYVPDEINHSLKIIVEYFGDAYHCNPRIYTDENQFMNLIQRTAGEQWQRDRKRLGVFHRHGYSVVIVWARDFRNSSKRELERIRDEITAKRNLIGII